jgi:hypothetical protein
MTTPSLHIRRWCNDFLVPHNCDAPERIRADLDDIADRLTNELAVGLTPWWSGQNEQVVLIKRMSFDCELDLSRKPELLAERWAYQFAKILINTIESGGDGVLRFSSPAAYRAQFIADLANGCSGDIWYYRPFAGLAALPPAGAIRTVLLEDSSLGREILTALSPEVWNRLGTVLTRREALRILDELSAGGSPDKTEPAALAALYKEHASRLPAAPWFVTALYLFSAALRAGFDPTFDLARWVRLAAKLPTLASRSDVAALTEALLQGNVADLVAADSEQDAESWVTLSVRPEWRSSLAEIIQAETLHTSARLLRSTGDAIHTAFGGLVLLLPELDNLLNVELSDALPPAEHTSARNITAWLVLAQCAGQARATQVLGEAFWREVFGIPPAINHARLNLWLADIDTALAAALLVERATGLARGTCLPTPLRVGGQRRMVSVDQVSGIWCGESLDLVSPHTNPLLLGEGGVRGVRRDFIQSPDSTLSIPWRARLTAARRARDDWHNLAMDWGLPEAWQRLFTHMAQIVLRRFAYRIPGFAGASLYYVYVNFLASTGNLDPESGRLLLSRPPLHVLLNITSIGRGTVGWSGPPEQSFVLDYAP